MLSPGQAGQLPPGSAFTGRLRLRVAEPPAEAAQSRRRRVNGRKERREREEVLTGARSDVWGPPAPPQRLQPLGPTRTMHHNNTRPDGGVVPQHAAGRVGKQEGLSAPLLIG